MKTILQRMAKGEELTRADRIWLHLACLWRDHKISWHLQGVWREVSRQ